MSSSPSNFSVGASVAPLMRWRTVGSTYTPSRFLDSPSAVIEAASSGSTARGSSTTGRSATESFAVFATLSGKIKTEPSNMAISTASAMPTCFGLSPLVCCSSGAAMSPPSREAGRMEWIDSISSSWDSAGRVRAALSMFAVLGAIRAACSAARMSSADGLFSARLSNMLLTKAVAASENSEPSAARSGAGSF